jgi:uncharacterized protein (DUF924 family)
MKKKIKHQDVLHFWFTEIAPESWFKKDVDFDAALKARFGEAVTKALAGRLDHWADNADGCLALIILLDQFTRNIFRQSARAFSGDEMALALSLRCVDRGYLDTAKVSHCHFMLMPMMHSEDLEIQVSSLPLFKKYKLMNMLFDIMISLPVLDVFLTGTRHSAGLPQITKKFF